MSIGSRVFGVLAKLPPPTTRDISVERDLVSKMPDGAELLADRWYPSAPQPAPLPTVLLRSPYGRRQLATFGKLFAERGFQAVIQSCRGTFGSAGAFEPFHNERADGAATLDWIAAQPWFNGQLVTFGPSYLGLTQWAVAETAPDYVKGMSLNVTASDIRNAIVYPSGSFSLENLLTWINSTNSQELGWGKAIRTMLGAPKAVGAAASTLPLQGSDVAIIGKRSEFLQNCMTREEPGDTWWDGLNYGLNLNAIPPTTLVGGWYDLFLHSQVADYEALVAAGRTSRLTIGPWHHGSPGGTGEALRDGLEFFNELTKGAPARRQPVRLFVMGSEHWAEYPQWPPAADPQRWYLGHGGTLSTRQPGEGSADRYRYNPSDPTPGLGGPSLLGRNAGPKDQAKRESRSDVLTYTSAVMTTDVTVVGPLSATLHVRSSLEHTDFHVRLCDVSPKGKSTNLSDGIVRLTPGQVAKEADGTLTLDISMWPTANTFKVGHRIRVQVASGAHPLFVRNLGSGERLASGTTMKSADQEIWHDPTHPSSFLLPVVQ